jgi:acetyltransferase-like isoleucine patch superfamily enzyme
MTLHLGRHSYGTPTVPTYPGDPTNVHVGAFCSIAEDVVLGEGGEHRTDWISTFPFRAILELPGAYADGHPQAKGNVVIGNDVWIGRGARVMSGVTVGDGAVIGAYAVVTHNVRPYAIVVGHPAHEIRRRFSDERVDALLGIRWWDWPDEQVLAAIPELSSGEIDAFIGGRGPQ